MQTGGGEQDDMVGAGVNAIVIVGAVRCAEVSTRLIIQESTVERITLAMPYTGSGRSCSMRGCCAMIAVERWE